MATQVRVRLADLKKQMAVRHEATAAWLLDRGAALDAMAHALIPDFQPKGVFRGTADFFARMDEENTRQLRRWLDEHTRETT